MVVVVAGLKAACGRATYCAKSYEFTAILSAAPVGPYNRRVITDVRPYFAFRQPANVVGA